MDPVERYRALLPDSDYQAMRVALQSPRLPGLRVNTLKCSRDDVHRWARRYGWQVEPVPFCDAGWRVDPQGTSLGDTLEYRMGHYYIQDVASMLPGTLFSLDTQQPLILDMAAAPGGKTTHLIDRSGDKGLVIANDVSGKRLPALSGNLQAWGATSSVVTNERGETLGGWWPDRFDAVLLDAPCSGAELHLSDGDGRKGRLISENEREQLHKRQVGLLMSAIQAARVGGEIVYATCTLAPEENEAVIDVVLKWAGEAIEVVDSVVPGITGTGITDFEGQTYHPYVEHAMRVWPHTCDTNGFFAALIRKVGPVEAAGSRLPHRSLYERGYVECTPKEQKRITDDLIEYGLDLARLLNEYDLTLWARNEQAYLIPALFVRHFDGMPFWSVGMLLGKLYDDGLIFSHEFASRFFSQMTGRRVRLDEDQFMQWMRGQDLRGRDISKIGRIVLVIDKDGRFVGRGKTSSTRLRNMLPRRWFG